LGQKSLSSEKIIKVDSPHAIRKTVQTLRNGGVIVYPTETLYGLGALVSNNKAARRIFQIKGRTHGMSLPILVRDFEMLDEYAAVPVTYKEMLQKLMPGPFMAILSLKKDINRLITGGKGKIGIRISSNKFVKLLMDQLSVPLISTSANISGTENIFDIRDLIDLFENKVDLIIDSGSISPSKGSTIVDFTVNPPKILREGDISKAKIREYF
jgi:L-threonylcarbamoyladenylate synthase